eukprot:jgi/Mesvir1/15071/Mv14718-RA.2
MSLVLALVVTSPLILPLVTLVAMAQRRNLLCLWVPVVVPSYGTHFRHVLNHLHTSLTCSRSWYCVHFLIPTSLFVPVVSPSDGTHFRYVLNWLRDGHVNLPPDATVLADIRVEASFYGLPSLVAHIVDAENRLAQANQQRQPHGPPAPPSSQPAGGSSSSSRTNGNEGDDTAVRSSADAGVKSINAATMTHESLLQQQKAVQESLLRGLERLLDRIQALQISQAEQAPGRTQGMDRKLVHSKSGPQGSGAGAGVAPGVAPMSPVAPAEAIASHAPSKVMPELDGARLVHRMEQNGLCKVGDVVVRVTYRVLEEFAKSCDRGHCRWESRCQLPLERQVDHDDVAQMVVLELWRRGICATYEVEYECLFSPSAAAVVNRVPRQLLFRGYPLLTLAQQPERAKQWAGWPANLMLLTLASGLVTEGRKMQVELS